jgi:hypothetical protein
MIQVYDKYGKIKFSGTPGAGTVTSFSAGNLSPLFTTSVTSPTSTPNISFTGTPQAQNLFYASPNGATGLPTFRAILESDLPSLSTTYVPVARTLTINGTTYDLTADRSWTIPTNSGTVTSVGLSMPSAFTVTNSPITGSGTIAVTGAGLSSQYIRGDGQLATLPSNASGGSAISYYLNGGTVASVPTYYQMSKIAVIGTGVDFSLAGNGLISQWLTDISDPNRLEITAGNWNFEMYMSASSSGGTPAFYVELLKYNGTTFTSIANNSAVPEAITSGTTIDLYLTALAIPQTTLLITDRLAIRVYIVNSTGGRTITMHTQNSHLCEIITNFAGGISALNGLTTNTQYLAVGTTGTDFNISSVSDTHTFNLPTANATNRGALSSTDWTTFNSKLNSASPSYTGLMTGVGDTQTGSSANGILDLSQTWNTTGAPSAIKLNVTDTASGAASKLLDIQIGGTSKLIFAKDGQLFFGLFNNSSTIQGDTTTKGLIFRTSLINITGNGFLFSNLQGSISNVSGTSNGLNIQAAGSSGFTPTSGNGNYNSLIINDKINQTGTATGTTTGLYLNPTLTSAYNYVSILSNNGKLLMTDTYSAGPTALIATGILDLRQTFNTTGTPTAIKLNVTDTASNASSLLMDLQRNATSVFNVTKTGATYTNTSFTAGGGVVITTSGFSKAGTFQLNGASGNYSGFSDTQAVNGNSGNWVYNSINISPSINQTGTPTGITRGLYISPGLVNTVDFRAIELTNNTGFGIYQSGTAKNTLAGNLLIGTTVDNGSKLQVNGNITSTTYNGYTPENTANKQNSLALDGTGVKFPTVDAVNNMGFIRAWKSGIDGVTVSNTTTITPTYTQLILANTFASDDVVELLFRATTSGTKVTATNIYIYVNTTANLSGSPIQVGLFSPTATIRTAQLQRALSVKGDTTKVVNASTSNATDTTQSSLMSTLTIDWTIDQYFVFAIGHTVASPTELMFGDFYRIIKN